MNPDPQRESALFQAATQLTGPARATFLNGACHGNPTLRQRLEALLGANDSKDSFLEPEAPPPDREPVKTMKLEIADAPDEAVGQTLGRYKLLERVGEGGCGVVYVAEQTEPVRRRVALKVIKLGMDTKQVVARFEAERQALAMMDHPNIPKVFDAGTIEPVERLTPIRHFEVGVQPSACSRETPNLNEPIRRSALQSLPTTPSSVTKRADGYCFPGKSF